MGGHVLWENLSYGNPYPMGAHVVQEDISYGRTHLMEHMSYRSNMSPMGGYIL